MLSSAACRGRTHSSLVVLFCSVVRGGLCVGLARGRGAGNFGREGAGAEKGGLLPPPPTRGPTRTRRPNRAPAASLLFLEHPWMFFFYSWGYDTITSAPLSGGGGRGFGGRAARGAPQWPSCDRWRNRAPTGRQAFSRRSSIALKSGAKWHRLAMKVGAYATKKH